jgi:hypothetical protein
MMRVRRSRTETSQLIRAGRSAAAVWTMPIDDASCAVVTSPSDIVDRLAQLMEIGGMVQTVDEAAA